ncbi:hypothetical protein [Polycladidibacter stylochi]|uniref:hypothetical protein n=1 Tax=Polycladidibacter stylochi TaxID=1807766 RepID=UPI000835C0F5|nr:hypothetical protein [Pseudovibrio stylochi]
MEFFDCAQDSSRLSASHRLLLAQCQRRGIGFFLDTQFQYVGYFVLPCGTKMPFKGTAYPVNDYGAGLVANDKQFCNGLLASQGVPVPRSILVHNEGALLGFARSHAHFADSLNGIEAALGFADRVGFSVFVKPNDGSQGKDVYEVRSKEELLSRLQGMLRSYDSALVQEKIEGLDYRLVVVGERVMAAIERRPLHVFGDGHSTFAELIDKHLRQLLIEKPSLKLAFNDARIMEHIANSGRCLTDVPLKGDCIDLLANANLSCGGSCVDVSTLVSQHFRKMAIDAVRASGLRYAGIDLLAQDIRAESGGCILEVNAGPSFAGFLASSKAHEARVIDVFDEVLKLIV